MTLWIFEYFCFIGCNYHNWKFEKEYFLSFKFA